MKYYCLRVPFALVCLATFAALSWRSFAQGPTASPPEGGQPSAPPSTSATPAEEAAKLPNNELDSLVAPIALYPDPLLAQTLAASTYPLEVVQLQQWLMKNKNLKGQALSQAVEKQDWDPSVQATAAFPEVVKRLADNIQWATDLGNAFLAQQSDVMDAVQRMRARAQEKGNLKTTSQQNVSSTNDNDRPVIKIEQASPDVVYVPIYDPTVVYGPPVYPYPAIWYPPPDYFAAGLAFGFADAVFLRPWWWNGAWNWGWNCGWGWGGGFININIHNRYVYHWNKYHWHDPNGFLKNNRWQHDPAHRGGAPYTRASARQVEREMHEREQGRAGGRESGDRPEKRLGQEGAGEEKRTAGERAGERERTRENDESRRARDRIGGRGDEERRQNFDRGDGERIGNRRIGREFGGGDAFGGGGWRNYGGDRMRDFSMRGNRSLGGFGGGGFRGGFRRR